MSCFWGYYSVCLFFEAQFKKILPFYLIKYNGKTEQLSDDAVQLSFMDDSDVVIEEE